MEVKSTIKLLLFRLKRIMCIVFIFLGLFSQIDHHHTVFAHRMLIDMVEDGLFKVRYDNGQISREAIVRAYDQNHQLLFEKQVDQNGYVSYTNDIHVARLVADDGLGHRASWSNKQYDEPMFYALPIWMRALLGLSALLFCASLFYFRHASKHSG